MPISKKFVKATIKYYNKHLRIKYHNSPNTNAVGSYLKNVDAQIWKEIARNLNQKFVDNVFNNRKPNIPFGSMISTVEKLVEDENSLNYPFVAHVIWTESIYF